SAKGDRYLDLSLPSVPSQAFDLALCSHFLFLYSDQLDSEFHIQAIRAMLGVAREVRVFPITGLSGETSAHLAEVFETFHGELVTVPYEFLRGANQMLVIRRSN